MKLQLVATTLLLAAPLSLAAQSTPDCTVDPGTPAGVQATCAVQHANFLYSGLCGSAPYCSSQAPQLLSAYKNAATLFDRTHSVNSNADDAFWSGFLHERAHDFSQASSTYAACMRIATYARDMTHRDNCAGRLAVIKRVVDNAAICPPGKSCLITVGGGGEAASVIDADVLADVHAARAASAGIDVQQRHGNAAVIAAPAPEDINVLGAAMTEQQKQAARNALSREGLSMTPAADATEVPANRAPRP